MQRRRHKILTRSRHFFALWFLGAFARPGAQEFFPDYAGRLCVRLYSRLFQLVVLYLVLFFGRVLSLVCFLFADGFLVKVQDNDYNLK